MKPAPIPPIRPSSQRTSRTTMIVQSIGFLLSIRHTRAVMARRCTTRASGHGRPSGALVALVHDLNDEQDCRRDQKEVDQRPELRKEPGQPKHQRDRDGHPDHAAVPANAPSRTSTWASALTRGRTASTRPSWPLTKLVLSLPTYLRPANDFWTPTLN